MDNNAPACPVCRITAQPYFNDIDYILECGRCGIIFDMRSSLDKKYYEKERSTHVDKDKIRSRERNVSQRAALIKGFLYKEASVLDIGCGEGLFLKEIKRYVADIQGLEPTEFYADYARIELKIDVIQGMIEDTDFPEASFNIITMFHVLEHFQDPGMALGKISRWLKPGGCLVIEVPDISSPYARYKGPAWELIIPEHRFHFTLKSLTGLLQRHNFIPAITRNRDFDQYRVGIGESMRKLLPFSAKIKKSEKVIRQTKIKKNSPHKEGKQYVKNIRRSAQLPLKAFLGWLVYKFRRGDYLFVVAKKTR
ncbi:MAG: class I SAM-dependent methyltransferase [Nitrospirae bacterium]|nr:class I SAM-dependent methyltransferase [Nitrospirota bacterium]